MFDSAQSQNDQNKNNNIEAEPDNDTGVGIVNEVNSINDRTVSEGIFASKARFKRRILHAPNAIQTMHNEEAYLIIYCLNCIRCMQNSTFETGLTTFNGEN